jgi:preprotein translocase subunit SecA
MKRKEDLVFEQLGLKEAIILTSLDEPLLKIFGGEKLIDIMQKLGMKEDEIIEHKMVSQSIANAQKKIEERMIVEQSVRSQSEWLERSLK